MTQFFKFQFLPLTSQYQCWIWPSFVAKSLKLCQQHWFGERGVFALENRFSILSQQFCPRLSVNDIFWKNHPNLLNGIEMHAGVLYALNSINFKLWKWFSWFNAHISHQNMVLLKATFNFYQIKHEKLSLLSLKPTQMSVWHQNLFQYVFEIKIKKIQVINMVSIKRYNHIIHWNIFLFSQNIS